MKKNIKHSVITIFLMVLSFIFGMVTVDHKCFVRNIDESVYKTPTEYFDHLESLQQYVTTQDSLIKLQNELINEYDSIYIKLTK